MQADGKGTAAATQPVRQDDRLERVMRQILNSSSPTPVVDSAGKLVGSVSREVVLAAVFPDP